MLHVAVDSRLIPRRVMLKAYISSIIIIKNEITLVLVGHFLRVTKTYLKSGII